MAVLAARGTAGKRTWLHAGVLQASPLALAGLVANGGSVLVTVVLARALVGRDYGALNQLIGVFFVVSTPGSAVLVAVVRRVARWAGPRSGVQAWGRRLHRCGTVAWCAGSVAFAGAGGVLAHLLGLRGALGVDAIAAAGGVWVLLCVDRGLLQAHREYRVLATNLLIEGGLRTVLMLGLGASGLGVTGAALGVLLAEVGTAVQARVAADRSWHLGGPVARRRRDAWAAGAPTGRDATVRRDLAAAVVTLAALALLQNVDVIAMGREAPEAAGAYGAVSVSCKAIVFLALVVAGYLLPEAALSSSDGGHALRPLAVSLAVLAVPAAVLLGVAAGAPRTFLAVAFSGRYVSASGAFLPLAAAMVCLSASVMLTMYLLAVGDRWFSAVLVGGAALATAAIALAHGAPRATAFADLGAQALVVSTAAAELVRVHRRTARRAGPSANGASGADGSARRTSPDAEERMSLRRSGGLRCGPVAQRHGGSVR